jgi:hypothetical protein
VQCHVELGEVVSSRMCIVGSDVQGRKYQGRDVGIPPMLVAEEEEEEEEDEDEDEGPEEMFFTALTLGP